MRKLKRLAEMPERSSESGQDYAAVESIEAVNSQLPLRKDRRNQPINHFLLSPTATGTGRSFQSGWFVRYPWLHYSESM